MDADIKRPGRKKLQILWTSFMDGPNTLKGWNELLGYLQTNNAFRKSKFINYNFDNSTLLPPLSTIQQGVLDYLNEFIALQSVRDEYYKELSKPEFLRRYDLAIDIETNLSTGPIYLMNIFIHNSRMSAHTILISIWETTEIALWI